MFQGGWRHEQKWIMVSVKIVWSTVCCFSNNGSFKLDDSLTEKDAKWINFQLCNTKKRHFKKYIVLGKHRIFEFKIGLENLIVDNIRTVDITRKIKHRITKLY